MRSARWLPAVLVLPLLFSPPARGSDEPAAAPAVTVEDLAWIAGAWVGSLGEDAIEEAWLAPAGGAMTGLFRWLKGGEVYLYEMFTLEPSEDGGVLLWLRHFKPNLVAWEDEDGAIPLHLVPGSRPEEAAFDNRDPENPVRVTYRRDGRDRMTVLLDLRRGGESVRMEFSYARADPSEPGQ